MFEKFSECPPDAVFGLTEDFKKDSNPNKVNLSVGVYKDESGQTPVMRSVHAAELNMVNERIPHGYLPIAGLPKYCRLIAELILGPDHPVIRDERFATCQTPGGTTALRVAGELLRSECKVDKIWMSNPTWANHPNIFGSAGLEVQKYDYLDEKGTGLDFARYMDSVKQIQDGQAILIHTVCHNPTGVDPNTEQWDELLQLVSAKQLVPVFDFAYQGFGESLDADASPIRRFANDDRFSGQAFVCNSFSKNFNLYGERVGGITAITKSRSAAVAAESQIKKTIRTLYSNPPMHGGQIVERVLSDADLRADWQTELEGIRCRISQLRTEFVSQMSERLPDVDFSHINRQRGMFSYSGIEAEQVDRLKNEQAIYLLRSGRINIAGMNSSNMNRICDAIVQVMSG